MALVPRRPSRSPSRKPGPRTKLARKTLAQGSKPKTQGSQLGYKSSTMTLAKPMSYGAMTRSLTKSMLETVMLRWNGVKSFDTRGNFWMENINVTGTRRLPFYMFDLTAVNNMTGTPPTIVRGWPFTQLLQEVATGKMYFEPILGIGPDGVTANGNFVPERAPTRASTTSPGGLTDVTIAPFGKSMIHWASIKANLWGCKSKATKYLCQIVRILDDDLVPDQTDFNNTGISDLTVATPKRNDFYQNLIKTYTFNPIATTGGIQSKKYKVLKSQTITIEPNPTTDGDADPQCVVYQTTLKMNKAFKYEETAAFLPTAADTNDQADYALNTGSQITCRTNPKARIFFVLRATNYGNDDATGSVNTVTPSFDLSVRVKHTIPK